MNPRSQSGYNPVGDARTGRPPLPDEREAARQPDEYEEESSQSAIERIASRGTQAATQTLKSAGEAVTAQMSAATAAARERGSALALSASEHAQTYANEFAALVRRRPLSALAGAVLLGLLVGLFRRNRST
jgi:ElaB/YqjD/DUF883 family membrane-anchored ribosome-binding protein